MKRWPARIVEAVQGEGIGVVSILFSLLTTSYREGEAGARPGRWPCCGPGTTTSDRPGCGGCGRPELSVSVMARLLDGACLLAGAIAS
jgi:hypothetical protein